jgi:hypothetical protein
MSQDLGLKDSHQTGDLEKQHGDLPITDVPSTDNKQYKATSGQNLKNTTTYDADVALHAFATYQDGQVVEIDEATNRRLLRKIDMHLMPVSIYV